MKIKAYSLTETLYTLALSSIIIGITYYFMASLFHQFNWYRQTSETTEHLSQQIYLINRSLFNSNKISVVNEDILMIQKKDTLSLINLLDENLKPKLISVDTLQLTNSRKFLSTKIGLTIFESEREVPFVKRIFDHGDRF